MNYQSEQIGELAKALSNFQGHLEGVEKDSTNPFFKSKYADLHAVWQAIRKPLADNGLSVTQINAWDHDKECLITVLMHASGQWIRSVMPIVVSKTDIQAFGGSMTYCKRYALQAIVGCSSYDDDGEEAMKPVRQEKPKTQGNGSTLDDLCKTLLEFSKEQVDEYVGYIAEKSDGKMSKADVIAKTMDNDISFASFRDKLKARVEKKNQAS